MQEYSGYCDIRSLTSVMGKKSQIKRRNPLYAFVLLLTNVRSVDSVDTVESNSNLPKLKSMFCQLLA